MPRRKRTEEELAESKRRRSLAGKKRWANLTQNQKDIVLARLAEGRAKRSFERGPSKKLVKKRRKISVEEYGLTERQGLHDHLLSQNWTKKEARGWINDLRIDLGLIKKGKRKAHLGTGLPQLTNPLPTFFAKNIRRLATFFKGRTQLHFRNLIKYAIPAAEATGIVVPGTPLFRALTFAGSNL